MSSNIVFSIVNITQHRTGREHEYKWKVG